MKATDEMTEKLVHFNIVRMHECFAMTKDLGRDIRMECHGTVEQGPHSRPAVISIKASPNEVRLQKMGALEQGEVGRIRAELALPCEEWTIARSQIKESLPRTIILATDRDTGFITGIILPDSVSTASANSFVADN